MAPLLAALASKGLSLIADAVMAKGKEVIEDKLGIELKEDMTPEEVISLKRLEVEHEEFLLNAALENRKMDLESTKNAQEMNTRIQESMNAAQVAKWGPYLLDFLIVGMTLVCAFLLLFKAVPIDNEKLVYAAFGSLFSMCMTILNFHRGTSASSQNKDATIHAMVTK